MQNKNLAKSDFNGLDIQLQSIDAAENSYNFFIKGKKVKIIFCKSAQAPTAEEALVKIATAGWE